MRLPGSIVTFYSYKGGVGRTMALANVAWLFAANGRRVLMVDWDLEAPGLHRYFHPFLNDPMLRQSRGLIDLLLDYVTLQQSDPKTRPADIIDVFSLANVGRVAIRIDYEFSNKGCLHIVGPGLQDSGYAQRVQNFDWRAFYDMYEGATFIDKLEAYIRDQYDIAFIDSRTGVADTSGICTLQIPDKVVLCFTYNRQSIEGIQMIANVLSEQPKPSRILLRPMRVEKDVLGIQAARSYAQSVLGSYTGQPLDRDFMSYWDAVEVPNYPAYSFEEILAVFAEIAGGRNNLLADMELLASEIDNARIRMPLLLEDSRQSTLASFRWRGPESKPSRADTDRRKAIVRRTKKSEQENVTELQHKVRMLEEREAFIMNHLRGMLEESMWPRRDQVFMSYSHQDVKWLIRLKTVLAPLIRETVLEIWDDTLISPGMRWREEMQRALRRAKVAVLLVSPEFLASEFIHTYELTALLDAEIQSGARVMWVPIKRSLVERTTIINYQALSEPTRPLDKMREVKQSETLIHIAKEIEKAYYRM